MDVYDKGRSSLDCEISIMRAQNIESMSSGGLFVSCYLSSGNNNRIRLNTREISTKSDSMWNEYFSLESPGTESAINSLRRSGNIVFELRRRCKGSFLGRICGSKLLGRAEIPWKDVLESPNMEIETWALMIPKYPRVHQDLKPPKVQVKIKIGAPKIISKRSQILRSNKWEESCGCKDCNTTSGCQCVDYIDYDFFAQGFALDTFVVG